MGNQKGDLIEEAVVFQLVPDGVGLSGQIGRRLAPETLPDDNAVGTIGPPPSGPRLGARLLSELNDPDCL
jgi:hypothetical protein